MRERKLRFGVNLQGTLKQKGVKKDVCKNLKPLKQNDIESALAKEDSILSPLSVHIYFV